jgi:hypothetical protein
MRSGTSVDAFGNAIGIALVDWLIEDAVQSAMADGLRRTGRATDDVRVP